MGDARRQAGDGDAPASAPLADPRVALSAWVHPAAVVIGDVVVGADASIWPGAVLRGDRDRIVIGAESNVQDGAVLHCDPGLPCVIGARVTIGHRAVVHGAVVAEGKEVPPGMLAAGVPAKVVKPLTEEQQARVARGYRTYVELKERYRSTGERG